MDVRRYCSQRVSRTRCKPAGRQDRRNVRYSDRPRHQANWCPATHEFTPSTSSLRQAPFDKLRVYDRVYDPFDFAQGKQDLRQGKQDLRQGKQVNIDSDSACPTQRFVYNCCRLQAILEGERIPLCNFGHGVEFCLLSG